MTRIRLPGPIQAWADSDETRMADQPRFLLYAYWRTSAAYRVRVALAFKGLAWEERVVDLDKGENRSEEFLRINPLGGVPALFDRGGGRPEGALTQSLAILDYLEEIAPTPPLLPADASGRARVRSIGAMLAVDTHPLLPQRVRAYLAEHGGFDAAAWQAWRTHWLATGLHAVERRLAAEPDTGMFCHGDAVTMADICLASLVMVQRVFDIEVADIPTIDAIMGRCENMEAFARAEPRRQPGAPAG